jgi:sec-independent protein translocase protein TatB
MFGIGLPELIVILGLALIVVGPDKLPDFARSIAKGILELKKTAEGLKDELTQEGGMLEELRPEIDAIKTFKKEFTESTHIDWQDNNPIDTPYTVKDVSETKEESSTSEQSANAESSTAEQSASAEASTSEQSAYAEASTEEDSAPSPHLKTAVTDDKQANDAGKKP